MYLLPYVHNLHAHNQNVKLFEVGLGCHPSTITKPKGIDIWRAVLGSEDEIWTAEINANCVSAMFKAKVVPKGVNVLLGDQKNETDLARWIDKSGGSYNVFIDDGSHYNLHIYNTFQAFWPHVVPGGFYFIEDLHVSRVKQFDDNNQQLLMADVVKDWVEQFMNPHAKSGKDYKHKIPKGVKFIMCQAEACVLAKCARNDDAWCY